MPEPLLTLTVSASALTTRLPVRLLPLTVAPLKGVLRVRLRLPLSVRVCRSGSTRVMTLELPSVISDRFSMPLVVTVPVTLSSLTLRLSLVPRTTAPAKVMLALLTLLSSTPPVRVAPRLLTATPSASKARIFWTPLELSRLSFGEGPVRTRFSMPVRVGLAV